VFVFAVSVMRFCLGLICFNVVHFFRISLSDLGLADSYVCFYKPTSRPSSHNELSAALPTMEAIDLSRDALVWQCQCTSMIVGT